MHWQFQQLFSTTQEVSDLHVSSMQQSTIQLRAERITRIASPRLSPFRSPRAHCVAGRRVSFESQILFMIYFFCGFFIPLYTMVICYSKVFYFLSTEPTNRCLTSPWSSQTGKPCLPCYCWLSAFLLVGVP